MSILQGMGGALSEGSQVALTGCRIDSTFGTRFGIFSEAMKQRNFLITHLDQLPPTRCPCGWARRAFADAADHSASVHLVDILEDSRTHYHKRMTEIYLVLEGDGQMELDGQLFPVKPMSAIYIKPGCRHRAIGRMRIINIPIPAFDPADEWFD